MKKLFSLFVVALATVAAFAVEPIILDPATQTTQKPETNAGTEITVTIDGVTLSWTGALYNEETNKDFRIYGGKTMTISAEQNISKVVIAGKANKAGLAPVVDNGIVTIGTEYAEVTTKESLDDPLIQIEDINATSVTLTANKQVRAYKIAVYFGEDTALESVEAEKANARKIVENGQVYILRDGVKYNIFGAVVD